MSSLIHAVINTTYGPVKGVRRTSSMGDQYYGFQGIPYAKPPIGPLRFRNPQKPEPWMTVLDATKQSSPAYAFNFITRQVEGSEDCLHLNVYTKELEPKTALPVMVWIHGGGFMFGSSGEEMYSPDYLLQKSVVLVTFNYRLGAFGFLSVNHDELQIPGNAGLKDQTLALKWVRDNVAQFGGDPENITLFGESAGGSSVHYHMVSDFSKNLFHKAILQSGTVLNYWALSTVQNSTERLAEKMGWDGSNGTKGAVAFLQDAPAIQIAQCQLQILSDEEEDADIHLPFGPVIEPFVSSQCFLPTRPILMSRSCWSQHIPMLIGATADEGLIGFANAETKLKKYGDGEQYVAVDTNYCKGSEMSKTTSKAIREFYFGEEDPSPENISNYINLLTHNMFLHGIHRTVMSRLTYATASTFLYRFDFDGGEFNFCSRRFFGGTDAKGVCHADELGYLFKNQISGKDFVYNSSQYKTMQRMVSLWTTFAASGNPNGSETKALVDWRPVESNIPPFKCINISDELTFIDLPETKAMAFWDSLYPKDLLV